MSYQESSSYQSSYSGNDLDGNAYGLDVNGGLENSAVAGNYSDYDALVGGGLGGVATENYSNYESASTTGYDGGFGGGLLAGNQGAGSEYYSSSAYGGLGLDAQASSSSFETGFGQQGLVGGYNSNTFEQQSASTTTTTYATDAQGLYRDANPQIIRRPAPGGAQTLTQRVVVRFLQPPPVPPPGPLIIKEVRPPQPPAPPPLFIRQRPPPPPVYPPVVIREAPPKMPAAVGTQVITKMLPALPVPPRSVIIERLPPLPPKPRDIVVERWLPYRAQQKRRVIIQRAPPPVIQKPRNIIIYYEAPKAQVVRRFENLGVQRANPSDYVARYGAQLEDSQSLLTHARQAGVVEDISPPAGAASSFQSSSYEAYQSGGGGAASGYDVASASAGGYDISGSLSGFGDAGLNLAGGVGGVAASSYESSSSYNTVGGIDGYNAGLQPAYGGYNLVDNTNNVAGSSSSYESYATQQTYSQ